MPLCETMNWDKALRSRFLVSCDRALYNSALPNAARPWNTIG